MAIKLANAVHHTDELGWPLCSHDQRVLLLLSETDRNPNKLLYRCGWGGAERCRYFFWVDDFEALVDKHPALSQSQLTTTRRHMLDACRLRNDENKLEKWSTNINDEVLAAFDGLSKPAEDITQFSDDDAVVLSHTKSTKDGKKRMYDVSTSESAEGEDIPATPKKGRSADNGDDNAPRPKKARTADLFAAINGAPQPSHTSRPSTSSPTHRRSKNRPLLEHIGQQDDEIAGLHETIDSLRAELAESKRKLKYERQATEVKEQQYHKILLEAYKKVI